MSKEANSTSNAGRPNSALHGRKDEFDLTTYFDGIHPRNYCVSSDSVREQVEELFQMTQAGVLHWVRMYGALARSTALQAKIRRQVFYCASQHRTRTDYKEWFRSPQQRFDNKSPDQWFRDQGLNHMAEGLLPITVCNGKFAEHYQVETLNLRSATQMPRRAQVPDLETMDVDQAAHLVRLMFPNLPSDWDDEFDIETFFVRCMPAKYPFAAREAAIAQRVYEVMRLECLGLLKIYRATLGVAAKRPHAVEKVVFCVRSMSVLSEIYRYWFVSTNPRFDGLSPADWFMKEGLVELEYVLGGGN